MSRQHQTTSPRPATAWSRQTLLHYWLLQLPALALVVVVLILLQHWVSIPSWLFWSIIVAWVATDAILYPLVWRAYQPAHASTGDAIIGAVGMTREPLDPTGYIVVHGVLWRAKVAGGGPPIASDTPVRIQARHGLTLTVVPDRGDPNA